MPTDVLQNFVHDVLLALRVQGGITGKEKLFYSIGALQFAEHIVARSVQAGSCVLNAEYGEFGGALVLCHKLMILKLCSGKDNDCSAYPDKTDSFFAFALPVSC